MEWINVNEAYLDYLRETERRIPKTDYGTNKYKPFFGVLFEVGDLYYVTQVSHPQDRHKKLKQQKDFYKLFDPDIRGRLIAVVNLNYMFPIPKEQTSPFVKKNIHTYRTFKTEKEKRLYISLLNTELKIINSKYEKIRKNTIKLYQEKINNPNSKISNRCCDFKLLEEILNKYILV